MMLHETGDVRVVLKHKNDLAQTEISSPGGP
jgi:hypothetical protein